VRKFAAIKRILLQGTPINQIYWQEKLEFSIPSLRIKEHTNEGCLLTPLGRGHWQFTIDVCSAQTDGFIVLNAVLSRPLF
jgi:hypothetical protein